MRKAITIAITGVTGLLGRNVYFEFCKQYLTRLDMLSVVCFGRADSQRTLKQRVYDMLLEDGQYYLDLPASSVFETIDAILARTMFIDFDLGGDQLSVSASDLNKLRAMRIDRFYHLASETSWGGSSDIKDRLVAINVEGTKRVLALIARLDVGEIIFSGSAYSAGKTSGLVSPDYDSDSIQFRNFYEESKLMAERLIKSAVVNGKKLPYRIFRLTGIGGRLLEKPYGAVSKYDIFLGWAQFFLKLKKSRLKSSSELFSNRVTMPIRIALNPDSGTNIVAVDYAAKMMVSVPEYHEANQSYHLVNDVDLPNQVHVEMMLEMLGIDGCTFVREIPGELNRFEKLYYKAIGRLFTPYIDTQKIVYDQSNLLDVREMAEITNPKMTESNFLVLLEYAKSTYFGTSIQVNDFSIDFKEPEIATAFVPPGNVYKKKFQAMLSDTSHYGNVYYLSIDHWIAHTKESFFIEKCPDLTEMFLKKGIRSLVVLEHQLKLFKEILLHEHVTVYVVCEKLKARSIRLKFYVVNQSGVLAAVANNRVVFLDSLGRIIKVPESVVVGLGDYVNNNLEEWNIDNKIRK